MTTRLVASDGALVPHRPPSTEVLHCGQCGGGIIEHVSPEKIRGKFYPLSREPMRAVTGETWCCWCGAGRPQKVGA